jgi:alkylhydroperoxidase family enzyme
MARLKMLPLDGIDETALAAGNRVNVDVFRILAHRPAMAEALRACINASYAAGTLPRRLLELVRIRIAFHNQCRSCMAIRFGDSGVSEDLVCALERPAEASDLTDAERSALRYADLFATNHLAIDEAVYDDLRRHFDEGEVVELGLHCALCVGAGRMAATWKVTDHVPERFKADGVVTPWGGGQLVVQESKEKRLLET